MPAHILLVEDEASTSPIIGDSLKADGHSVELVPGGKEGFRRLGMRPFDLVVLNSGRSDPNGLRFCHALREGGFAGAILMLLVRSDVSDRVRCLHAGADDCLVKPCDPDELRARVSALLRRTLHEALTPVLRFNFGQVRIDFERGEFCKDGQPLALSAKEVALLRMLIDHRGRVLSREAILNQVWREQPFVTVRTVDVHVAWLRQKIEDRPQKPSYIVTVRGAGYRFLR